MSMMPLRLVLLLRVVVVGGDVADVAVECYAVVVVDAAGDDVIGAYAMVSCIVNMISIVVCDVHGVAVCDAGPVAVAVDVCVAVDDDVGLIVAAGDVCCCCWRR